MTIDPAATPETGSDPSVSAPPSRGGNSALWILGGWAVVVAVAAVAAIMNWDDLSLALELRTLFS